MAVTPTPKTRPSSDVIATPAAIPNPLVYANQQSLNFLMDMLQEAKDKIMVKDRNGAREVDVPFGLIWNLNKNYLPKFSANETVVHSEHLTVNISNLNSAIDGEESQARPDPLEAMSYDGTWFPQSFLSRVMPPGLQTCLENSHRSLVAPLTYTPDIPDCTLEEFYGLDGPVDPSYDFHT